MGVVKFLIGSSFLILVGVGSLHADILFDKSYSAAELFALPDGATAPSGRVVSLNGDVLEFPADGGGQNDVLYRVPVVAGGTLSAGDRVRVSITVDEQSLAFPGGDDDFGGGISDGSNFIGYMNSGDGNDTTVWFVHGVDNGASYSSPEFPAGSLPDAPLWTSVIDLGSASSTVTTTQGGMTDSNITVRPLDITQDLSVILVGDSAGEEYGVRLLEILVETLEGGVAMLTVDRDTGGLTLSNSSAFPIDISGYSITSAAGALTPENWLSVAENYDAGGDGSVDANNDWTELTDPQAHGDLSEGDLQTGLGGTLGPGQEVTLSTASAWLQNPAEDLVFEYLSDGEVVRGGVAYRGNDGQSFFAGDFDFDNDLDADDWGIFRSGQHTDLTGLSPAESYRQGDLTGDGQNNHPDFVLFKTAFDQQNGAGALAALLAGVPEPTSAALVIISLAVLASRKRAGA